MKTKLKPLEEVNAMKTPTGNLILDGIRNQASVVCNIAGSLAEFGSPYYSYRYGNDHDGDEQPATDVPEAVTEMVSAMKDSAKNLLRMVNSFARAEAGTPDVTIDGPDADDAVPEDTAESLVLAESVTGEITAVFTEGGTATITKGQVSGTMIVAGMNADHNRFYTEEALQDAVSRGLWNGKKMYLDHMRESDKRDLPARSVKDIAAVIKETRYDSGSKSIKYTATLADPSLETKLAYMQERGILSGMGVSIHAAGQGRKEVIESAPAFVVERFVEAYSTDFVTNAGAGGTIDMLESDPRGDSRVIDQTGANTMDEKAMAALLESMGAIVAKAVAPLAEAQTKLQARQDQIDTRDTIKTMIEATALPDIAKTQLVRQFMTATTTDGVEEAIKGMTELVEAVKGEKTDGKAEVVTEAKRVAKPSPVKGLGTQETTESGKHYRTAAEFAASPAAKILVGGKNTEQKANDLFASMR